MEQTIGIRLKNYLGLYSLPKVYYARVIGLMAYKVYFVFFDSRRPYVNITSYEAHKKIYAPVIPFKGGKRRLSLTNILRIEEFTGSIENSLFIRVDLSGRFQQMGDFQESVSCNENNIPHILKNTEKTHLLGVLCEDMHIEDFNTLDAASAMTQKFRNIRKQLISKENVEVKLKDFQFDRQQDWVQFVFESNSTPNAQVKKLANPQADFVLQPTSGKVYTLILQFDSFFAWLLDTLPDGQALTLKDMKDAIRICPVKLWSNSPAFHWQGTNYQLTQLGAAIYPTDIAPTFWNQPKYHGDNNFLDKHFLALLRHIAFFLNHMTAMANKRLQKAGIVGKVKYNFQP